MCRRRAVAPKPHTNVCFGRSSWGTSPKCKVPSSNSSFLSLSEPAPLGARSQVPTSRSAFPRARPPRVLCVLGHAAQVSTPKSQPSTLPLRSVTHRSLALGRTAQAPSRSLKPSTRPPDTEMGEPPKVRGLGRPSQAPSPSPNPLLARFPAQRWEKSPRCVAWGAYPKPQVQVPTPKS